MARESNSGEKYEYLHHIADAKFRAYGSTLEEAFENAALAMFNVMIDTANLRSDKKHCIEIISESIENLLIDWLSELLYLFEVDGVIFGKFDVKSIKKTGNAFSLRADASGEMIDLSRHSFVAQVKAVTFHDLEIKTSNGISVQVIVDT